MKELRRKQEIKQAVYSYPSLAILALVTFFLVKGAFGLVKIERDSANKVKTLEAESVELLEREEVLKQQVARLQTPEGIEEEIKDKFSATREGEYVAIIVDERNKAATGDSTDGEWLSGFWKKMKNLWVDKP